MKTERKERRREGEQNKEEGILDVVKTQSTDHTVISM